MSIGKDKSVHGALDAAEPGEQKPDPTFPDLSDTILARIVVEMHRNGFGVAYNCIDPARLLPLQEFVAGKIADAGGEYVALTGRGAVSGTMLEALSLSPEFKRACQAIYRMGTGDMGPDVSFYQVLRSLSGKTGEKHAYFFHYDSYVITALVPVLMPSAGKTGDLIMFPNLRGIRKSYVANLLDKVLLDNRVTQFALKWGVTSGRLRSTRVRMQPGNVYFFWGYRSVHANEPCDRDQIRATALFHYVNPHVNSRARRLISREA
ncbi:MAG: hypothetical protein ABF535_02520 [Acetobacter sp.]